MQLRVQCMLLHPRRAAKDNMHDGAGLFCLLKMYCSETMCAVELEQLCACDRDLYACMSMSRVSHPICYSQLYRYTYVYIYTCTRASCNV